MQGNHHKGERGPRLGAASRGLAAVVAAVLSGVVVVLGGSAGPVAAGPAEDTAFVRAVHVDLLEREPTSNELGADVRALGDGRLTRAAIVRQVSYGLTNLEQEVTELYLEALERAPDATGFAYFVNTMGYTSYPLSRATAAVYSSREYVNLHGGAPEPWVDGVFADLLGRTPDAAGRSYWTGVAATEGPTFAALRLYESAEHRRTRVTEVFQEMLGRAPEPEALAFWTSQLTVQNGDLWLAIKLGSTPEYDARAVARFP